MLKLVTDRCYHVEGWKPGTQFRLLTWDEASGIATIQRPLRRGKKWRIPITKLRNTKRHGANKEPYKIKEQ